ncbi:hypothetical protein [Flavobacterium sp. I3-2]|uniref:hypothetical protein n=1 Tax=Flavobacterium sp. I3-2 TaxID=2748319 RepID=UPI0015AD7C6D|nr:hypothetical protein [Flavobacterium sp. I3-2]
MTLNQQPELKEAILKQSEKEKDKLLIRLINKDKKLMQQLHYLLLENEDDLIDRIQTAKTELEKIFERTQRDVLRKTMNYRHKELTSYLRIASGLVNEHASVTKNKESELDLRLLILEEAFDTFHNLYLENSFGYKSDLHFIYQTTRIKSVISLYEKLHEDLQYEYRERLSNIMKFVHTSILSDFLVQLNVNYLNYLED